MFVKPFPGRAAAAAAALVFALACGACGSQPTAPSLSIAGTWQGTFESGQDGPGEMTMKIVQTGPEVSGEIVLSQNGIQSDPGSVSGLLSTLTPPATMQLSVSYQYGPFQCRGTLIASLTVNPMTLEGPFTGANCVRDFSGVLRASKKN